VQRVGHHGGAPVRAADDVDVAGAAEDGGVGHPARQLEALVHGGLPVQVHHVLVPRVVHRVQRAPQPVQVALRAGDEVRMVVVGCCWAFWPAGRKEKKDDAETYDDEVVMARPTATNSRTASAAENDAHLLSTSQAALLGSSFGDDDDPAPPRGVLDDEEEYCSPSPPPPPPLRGDSDLVCE
jgi:hypothetical protein